MFLVYLVIGALQKFFEFDDGDDDDDDDDVKPCSERSTQLNSIQLSWLS